ncbi:MAG: metallophosphoesterase family protein [Anaerolineales bacterium]
MQDMKTLIISDIHANLTALEAVLADAQDHDYEAVWCLGDLVGYGPDPNECVERVRELPDLVCLIGNHDQAALGKIPLERFNQDARSAASWTQRELTEANETYLRSLPSRVDLDQFTLAHGSPRQPVWEYILDPQTAEANFEAFETHYCLVGHSHLPLVFHKDGGDGRTDMRSAPWDHPLDLKPRMILNPGSVGQPRDMDPRAAYALLDTEALTWQAYRVRYDVEQVQRRMKKADLPERQAIRLGSGW